MAKAGGLMKFNEHLNTTQNFSLMNTQTQRFKTD